MRQLPSRHALAATIAALAVAAVLLVWDRGLLRAIIAIPLVLLVPGYGIISTVFSKYPLGRGERLLLSAGVSLAVSMLGGLLLTQLPWGLQTSTWVVLLVIVTVLATYIALRRGDLVRVYGAGPRRPSARWYELTLFGLAALVLVAALTLACLPVPQTAEQGYTQLWLLPSDDVGSGAVRVGIGSMEAGATSYRLELRDNDKVVQKWSAIVLEPSDQWESTVLLPAALPGGTTVEAILYRADTPDQVYRHTTLRYR